MRLTPRQIVPCASAAGYVGDRYKNMTEVFERVRESHRSTVAAFCPLGVKGLKYHKEKS